MTAIGYGLVLPVLASLHVRNAAVRQSGATLGTIAGTGVVILGLLSSAGGGVMLGTLFVAGVWWWTIGKMWIETAVLPRLFGYATAALALACFAIVIVTPFAANLPSSLPVLLLCPWLLLLAPLLWRSARLP